MTGRPRRGSPSGVIGFAIALLATAAGCSGIAFPDRDPTLSGEIVGVGTDVPFGGPRTVWVKTDSDSACGIVFRVEPSTDIAERQPDDSLEDRRFEDLAVGRRVRVWAGAVAESCPGQALADVIEIELTVDIG